MPVLDAKDFFGDSPKTVGGPVAAADFFGAPIAPSVIPLPDGRKLTSPDADARLNGLMEAIPAMVTGAPAFFVGTFAKPVNAILNKLQGSERPWHEAVEETDQFLSQFTYQPRTKEGERASKVLTYGAVAATAPYLLPLLGVGEALDSETAKKAIPEEKRLMLKQVNDMLMLGVPVGKAAFEGKSAARAARAELKKPTTTLEQEGFVRSAPEIDPKTGEKIITLRPTVHPDWFEGLPKPGEKVAPSTWDQELGRAPVAQDLKAGGMTINEITDRLASGDRSVLPAAAEAVKTLGPEAATDTLFNGAFGKAGKNKTLKSFAALEQDLRKVLRGEKVETPAEHIETTKRNSDGFIASGTPEAKEYKQRGFIGTVSDKLNIDPFKRTARVSEPVADAMATHAGSYGQGNRVTNWLVSKIHPDAFEHLPQYISEKVKSGGLLSKEENRLYLQSQRRNAFGSLLVKDRIVGIWRASLDKIKVAEQTISDLKTRQKSLVDQQRRALAGKGAPSDPHILPDLSKKIEDIKNAIGKAERDRTYYTEKAHNIGKVHDVHEYESFVKNNVEQFADELESWKKHVNPYLDDLLREAKGLGEGENLDSDNVGYITGARVNLIHADILSTEWEQGHAVKNKVDLVNKEKPAADTGKSVTKDPWDREAKGTGSYSTSLYGMLRPVVSRRLQSVTKLRLYAELEKSGLGKLVGSGEAHPGEIKGRPMVDAGLVEVPKTVDGKTTTVSKHLFVGEDILPEIKQLFLEDKDIGEVPGARAFTTLQLSQLATDAVSHGMNQFSLGNKFFTNEFSRAASKIPLLSPAEASTRFFKYAKDVFENTPETIERIKEMGEHGLLRDGYHVSWLAEKIAKLTGRPMAENLAAGQMLVKMDTAMRMILDDHFKMMVKEGLAKDTATNRRNFVLQVGNYNARMMEHWMASLRRSSVSPFVVAGSTFLRNSLRFLTGHPGFETTGPKASFQLRAEHLTKPIIFGLTIPAMWNMYKTGHALGRPGTPPGHLDMGSPADENGKFATFNLMIGTPYDRAMRLVGGQALWEGVNSGKTAGQIAAQAALDSARSLKHIVWGPGMEGLFVAATGRDTDFSGHPHLRYRETLPGKIVERGRAALEATSPQAYALLSGENAKGPLGNVAEDKGYGPVEKRLMNVADLALKAPKRAVGISESHVARTAAEQEIVDRMGHMDSAPDAGTAESRRVIRKGMDLAKKDEEAAKNYLYENLDSGKITEKQFAAAWRDRETPKFALDFKNHTGVGKTSTEKGSYSALYVYKLATEAEKAQVTEILNDKIERAWKSADASKQRELLKAWHSILPEVF